MTSHYRNTISLVYLLLCLFIASVSPHSFIRQVTDGFNPNLHQEEGAGPDFQENQEISLRDHQVSASSAITGLRDHPPSSYTLKMESFNTLLKSTKEDRYESRPFSAAGYNWTLVVYPKGNQKDSGSGYLSLYVTIDNSTLAAHQQVYADLRFYIYNKNVRKYFTIQDANVWRFSVFKTMWGFPQVLSVDTFKYPRNGYLYDGDHCEFGVDVTVPSLAEKSELFTVTDNIRNSTFTWTIRGFSTLLEDSYPSDLFSIGGRSWNIEVNPNGFDKGQGNSLSMFLQLNADENYRTYERIYVRAKLRVLNQRSRFRNVEGQIDRWYNWHNINGTAGYRKVCSWGFPQFMSLAELRDSSKGYLVNDVLKVQAEIEVVSSTKYFP